MQEEVENRTLTLVVSGTKFTGRLFKAAITKYLDHRKEKKLQKQKSRDITVLQTLVIALGAGLGIWGVINLLEGYGNDNPGAKSQGMKQLMAGAGVAVVGMVLVPLLSGLFTV